MDKDKVSPKIISKNKKSFYNYSILEKFEAGIILQGWEVKSIRAGKIQIIDSHIHIKHGEAWLFNCFISPLTSASTHVSTDPTARRKLLLHRREINTIMGKMQQKSFTCVPLTMYWKGAHIKIEIALAQGKKTYDKRQAQKDKDWQREKEKLFKKILR